MADYRCYFLGPATKGLFGAPTTIETAVDFTAESDDMARLEAEALYRQRRNQIHGYEIWQGTRLVHRRRHDMPPGGNSG